MATLATLQLDILANTANLTRGVEQVNNTIGGLENRLKGVATAIAGAFSVAAIGSAVKDVTDQAGAIQDAADKIGISAEAVQRLKFAAEQGGGSIEQIGTAVKIMAGHLQDPSKGAVAAFDALGLSVDKLQQMTPDQAFTTIADAIAKVPDPLKQSAFAADLFGKAGNELLPAIKAGFTAIGEQAPIMSNAVVKAADDAGDQWAKMQGQIDALKAKALTPLLETFMSMPESVQVGVGALASMMPVISQVGIAVMAVGGPAAAFGALTTAMGAASTFITATLIPAIVPLLPIVGIGGAIALGVFGIYEAWKHWDKIVEFFRGAWQFVVQTIGKIPDSLLPLLGPIGGIVAAFRHWDEIKRIVEAVYVAAKNWLLDKFTGIVDGIKKKIDAVTGFFSDMYDQVVGHSFVPDMIDQIGQHFGRLDSLMTNPARAVTDAVEGIFKSMSDRVGGIVGGMLEGVGGKLGSAISGLASSFLGGLGGMISSGVGALIGAVSNKLRGGEEGIYVNPNRDRFFAQFQGEGGLPIALTDAFIKLGMAADAGTRADQLIKQLYSADSINAFSVAQDAIASVFKQIGRDIQTFRTGTVGVGFQDFGEGTLALLHGREAVVPESRAGDFAGRWGGNDAGLLRAIQTEIADLRRALARELAPSIGRSVGDALAKAPRRA